MECDLLTVRHSGWLDASMQDVGRRGSPQFKDEGRMSALKTHKGQAQLCETERVNMTLARCGKQESTGSYIRSDNTQLTCPQGLGAVEAFGRLCPQLSGWTAPNWWIISHWNSLETEPVLALLHPEEIAICWGPYPQSWSQHLVRAWEQSRFATSQPLLSLCNEKPAGGCLHFSTQAHFNQRQDGDARYYYFQGEGFW